MSFKCCRIIRLMLRVLVILDLITDKDGSVLIIKSSELCVDWCVCVCVCDLCSQSNAALVAMIIVTLANIVSKDAFVVDFFFCSRGLVYRVCICRYGTRVCVCVCARLFAWCFSEPGYQKPRQTRRFSFCAKSRERILM